MEKKARSWKGPRAIRDKVARQGLRPVKVKVSLALYLGRPCIICVFRSTSQQRKAYSYDKYSIGSPYEEQKGQVAHIFVQSIRPLSLAMKIDKDRLQKLCYLIFNPLI